MPRASNGRPLALVRKATGYDLLAFGWVLAVGAGFVVISGNAEPYIAARTVPEPIIASWGGAGAVLVLGGRTAVRLAKKRAWRQGGRQAGLVAGSNLLP
jgi:hypothetical protein